MTKILRWLVPMFVVVVLSGCGGDSGGGEADTTKPTFTSSASAAVAENQTSAITLKATDESTITYGIKDGDASSFNVNASTGVVTFKTAPDYETKTSYTFTATATDSAGNEATQDVTITITDVDEVAPVFTSSASATVAENQTSAITLKATDESTIAYGIKDGDASSFSVNASTGVVTFKTAPDFETKKSYTFTATATDSAGNEASQNVTITITDVDEVAPVFTSLASVSVAENQTDALTLAATDVDSVAVTYGISGGDSGSFDLDAATGVVTFKTAPNFETKDTYGFTATATDGAGNSATQSVVINITDLPEPEGQPKKTGQTKSYDEDGNEVADGSIKDDGYYQTGVTPNYTRDNAKQIVTDHITGLEWQDDGDASSVTKPWLTQENYDKCTGENDQTQDTTKCYDTSGDTAATYCENLTLDGGVWRLPTVQELRSIVVDAAYNPSIDTAFKNYSTSDRYWSSTTPAGSTDYAWIVHFNSGYTGNKYKSNAYYVRCVRARQ